MLLGVRVAAEVAALQPIDENLCLSDVSAQSGCLQPHRGCSAVPAGDILAFDPSQLGGHLVQLVTQRADQLHSLALHRSHP
jgi:hypothetical protein